MKVSNYDFRNIEKTIQDYWAANDIFRAHEDPQKPKRYILDMFPYPSGAGLHVGHLLGYFANDVTAIHARMEGYSVLHPMGFDAFGLPAEQYAIDTGQHPAVTTEKNKKSYKKLFQATGLSFNWERELSTTDPEYYTWTQWIFLLFFNSWYNKKKEKAEPIESLRAHFEKTGNKNIEAASTEKTKHFSAQEWQAMSQEEQEDLLSLYRLAYLSEKRVNWCPALGTVLANDEVQDGYSERGGHPVEQKKMRQWSLRMTAYADRLLNGLENLDWPDDVKEIQRNWIGRSEGAEILFLCDDPFQPKTIEVFTTRPETLFGVSFIALAPEHPLVQKIIIYQQEKTTAQEKPTTLENYVTTTINRPERERVKNVEEQSGCFTGFHARHPVTNKKIPIWVAEYVLPHYGSGAVMGVPAHDQRDYLFAKKFGLPILEVISGGDLSKKAHETKQGLLVNSDFLNGLTADKAKERLLKHLKAENKGEAAINFRLHDADLSRQRYWGEPIPMYEKNGRSYPLNISELPLELPSINVYAPTKTGEPPLARAQGWTTQEGHPLEPNTMPAWAGSSWYFFRYMSPNSKQRFVDKKAADYWQAVDLYMGGKEHATGHLLYARFFTKVLYDLGYVTINEPFQKLVNQGMIQNTSYFVYRIKNSNQFVSKGLKAAYETIPMRVDIQFVNQGILDLDQFKKWRPDLSNASFILENGCSLCGEKLEKMSKSKHNTVDPLPIIQTYGADTLRLYLLFLGPLQQVKIWTTQSIGGIVRFMKKSWKLFHAFLENTSPPNPPSKEENKILHQTIKQVQESIKKLSFNTAISAMMICVNKLTEQKCRNKHTLESLLRLLAPFAPHMSEHLWKHLFQKQGSIIHAPFPKHNPLYLKQEVLSYPVAINGKTRSRLSAPLDITEDVLKQQALNLPNIQKWLHNKQIVRIIVVSRRMINIVTK